ncbi:MAG: GxxExxY protein [Lentisphaerales bacterium]|nr:GxxExxY protein [Lentisphaerales bacterium]
MYKQQGYDLMGAAFEVYNELGHGFLEEVYQEALEYELSLRNLIYESQPQLNISYKSKRLKKFYRLDLYMCGGIVVELKAIKSLTSQHEAQVMNYLKVTRKAVGDLINFGNDEYLEWKRFILSQDELILVQISGLLTIWRIIINYGGRQSYVWPFV